MTRRRRIETEPVRPTVPVVPLLVLAVLPLAYHIFIYRYDPWEVGITWDNPSIGHDPDWLDFHANRSSLVVTVAAGPDGSIVGMTLEETNRPSAPKWVRGDLRAFRAELVAYRAARPGPPPRMKLEVGPGFTWQGFVELLAAAREVGFKEVLAYPADEAGEQHGPE